MLYKQNKLLVELLLLYYNYVVTNEYVIQTDNLCKRYNKNAPFAIYNLKIKVKTGEIYGFIGPNGSGKSTTIKTLLNFIQPTSGTATIFNKNIVKDSVEIKKSLGYLSGDFSAYSKMTGQHFLQYMSKLQPLKHKNAISILAKIFKLNLKVKISELSKGNRQKLGIIQACMHEPKLLILDEPTDGLDPLMQETFYHLLRTMQARGTTTFISSHNLVEVQKICNRVAIIRDGQLVAENSMSNLLANATQTFEVTFKNPLPLTELKSLTNITNVKKTAFNTISFQVKGNLKPALNFLAKSQVVHIATKELSLEDEFLKFYETES